MRYRDFRFLFFAQLTNAAAQWMQMIGLPILVLSLTSSPVHLAMVMIARTVPAMVLGLVSGVVADMWDRRTILITTRVVGTALATWFAVINVLDSASLVEIYVFAVLRGSTMAFDQAPRRALIPSMVPKHAVVNAMALSTGGMQVMRMLAASMAGTLIAVWGIDAAFVALALLYVSGVPLLLVMRTRSHERSGYRGVRQMVVDAKDGLGFAVTTPAMRASLIITAFFFVFGMSFSNVFAPLLADGPLGLTEGGLGWMVAVMGFGGTVGTITVAYLSPSHHRGIVLIIALAVFGFLLSAMAGASYLPVAWVAFVVIFFVGTGQSVFMPLLSTMVLQAAPDHMRGRAMAILGWDRALVSFGTAIAGFASAAFGAQVALLGFGGACVIGALVLLSSGTLRKLD
ncbi:MAG: MFS transporter [Chloroflexi bacterium]|nr:MFS transporter [Chloroflexota bacterium]MDA1173853.1 MFS transporter [Chloroflexota bacterium]